MISFIGGESPEEKRGFESGIGGGHRAWGDAGIEGAECGRTVVDPKGEAAIAFVGVAYLWEIAGCLAPQMMQV